VGGKKLPEAGPPKSILAPPVIASSTHEPILATLDPSIMGPRSLAGSKGSPMMRVDDLATKRSRNSE
jgi:hypothetical protein